MLKRLKKISIFIIVLFIIGIIFYHGVFLYIQLFTPKLSIKNANSVALYDSDDNLFFQGNSSQKWIELESISSYVIDATIAVEDRKFFSHRGFDYPRILKAASNNINAGKTVEGASTITQQYARNLFLNFDQTWQRKWDEMWYTLELEAHYSKEEILEGYLNTINYGHANYGIEQASQFYFNKSASELSLAEASLLVGIPKSPSNFSPLVNEDNAKNRQWVILDAMKRNKMITENEMNSALNEPLSFIGKNSNQELSSVMYYKDAVLQELERLPGVPRSYIQTDGLKVFTTLDLNAQRDLENGVRESLVDESNIQVSSIMMDPNTGGIIALLGGRDYNKSEFNRVLNSKRQVGSTMKPFLYYAALETGFTSSTAFRSEETTFTFNEKDSYSPRNFNEQYGHKPISMGTAIAYSDNVYAVKTHMFLGKGALVDISRRLGITADLSEIPSLPLGTKEINILEMTRAYAAFANEGYKVEPHFITRVEDQSGNILYERDIEKTQILNRSLTFILNNLLTSPYDPDYIDYNYPTAIQLSTRLDHKYGIKSGTTDTDNWFIGFNKNIVTSVWIGYDDNQHLIQPEYRYAQNIWRMASEAFMAGKDNEWYERPNNISLVLVDPITGIPVTEHSNKKKIMYFIKGTEPTGSEHVFDQLLSEATPS